MAILDHLWLGFTVAATWHNLLYAFIGCLLGTLIGVLPGLGPVTTIAMLLPFTYGLPAESALIMLAGIYYGAQYGGSTTAILMRLPGEVSSVITVLDGYEMARGGRAGAALATAAIGSFIAGCIGTLVLAAFAIPLSNLATTFGSPEYFSLMALGLVGSAVIASDSIVKSISMVSIGILLGLVGADVNTGSARFTFGMRELWDGIDFVTVAIGLFAFTEIVGNLELGEKREAMTGRIDRLWPTREEFRRMIPASLRGTGMGVVVGSLPGAGPTIAAFGAYFLEKRLSRTPERFGQGAIEGVAAPESANNAAAQCAFVPTLALGIPGSATMALMLAAMMIHDIQPGPNVVSGNPALFWGLVVSMWIGNLMLLILNLPLVGIWVRLLRVPYWAMYPAILVFCCIGVYASASSIFAVYLTAGFGLLGYVFRKLNCEPAPLMLGFVLGPMMEENFRRSLVISRGDFSTFLTHPISLGLLLTGALLIAAVSLPTVGRFRDRAIDSE